MARPNKPWFWEARGVWACTINGKRKVLAKGKSARKEAYRQYLTLADRASDEKTTRSSVGAICDHFMQHARSTLKPNTVRNHEAYSVAFCNTLEDRDANAIQPRHVLEFLNAHQGWGPTSRSHAVKCIKRVWAWALEQGYITLNLLKPMKKQREHVRSEIPDDREMARFVASANPAFRELLTFLGLTGCRPGEAAMMEKRHVDLANREVRFKKGEDKTSGKTDRPRVIHLCDEAYRIVSKLAAIHETGPLFRNMRGNRWTKDAMHCAAMQARKKAGIEGNLAVTYAVRHQYITTALARGVPIAVVAELVGNSPEMIAKVYSHISEKKALLLEAANMVRPN